MMVQFDVKRVQKGTESFMVSFDFTKTPVTQVADYIIIAASKLKTSDIHFSSLLFVYFSCICASFDTDRYCAVLSGISFP